MNWLWTVLLLLIEILVVMKLEGDNFTSKTWTLGVGIPNGQRPSLSGVPFNDAYRYMDWLLTLLLLLIASSWL